MNEKGREWEEEEATWHFTQKKVNLQKYSSCDRTVAGMYSRFWEMKAGRTGHEGTYGPCFSPVEDTNMIRRAFCFRMITLLTT